MKPDWKDAPEWAQWLAGDAEGFIWSEAEPEFLDSMWADDESNCFLAFGGYDAAREVFKEPRP